MNVDVQRLLADGERAYSRGSLGRARRCFLEAGRASAEVQLWRGALRCYRQGLELDLVDRSLVSAVLELPWNITSNRGWDRYVPSLAAAEWRSFSCRTARIVVGPRASFVDCPPIGPVLDLAIAGDRLELRPIRRFATMPVPMAMIIVRRALSTTPLGSPTPIVSFGGVAYRLDEQGDWELQS